METSIKENVRSVTESNEFNGEQNGVDSHGFVLDFNKWTEEFTALFARQVGISDNLTKQHWNVIFSMRRFFSENGRCPSARDICKTNRISVKRLLSLFPAGYVHGVCRLSGIPHKDSFKHSLAVDCERCDDQCMTGEKTYVVDVRGFLTNPEKWEPEFAFFKAYDMNLPMGLTDLHWQIIYYLRECFNDTGVVPTVYQTCEANGINSEQMDELFPDGFSQGALKIAGLRER